MKKSHEIFIAVASSVAATLFGIKLTAFVRADKCLDLGGRVTSWGACQLGDSRAEMLSVSLPILFVILVCSVVSYLVASYILKGIYSRALKT